MRKYAVLNGPFYSIDHALKLPPLSPPQWLFPVVWGIIYALLGASAYLIFKISGEATGTTRAVFITQLVLNLAWSVIFFRIHALTIAAVTLVALTVCVGIMLLDFYRKMKIAGFLNILYLFWCMFACYLNIGIAMLN